MTFGFSLDYSQSLPLDGLLPLQFYKIVSKATDKLNWKLVKTNESEFVCRTLSDSKTPNLELKITLNAETADINYDNRKKPILEWNKGKAAVLLLTETIGEFKSTAFQEEIVFKTESTDLENNLSNNEETIELKSSPKDKIKNFFSIFVPTEGYFITPILININIGVFILMTLTGVDIFAPDGETLLSWGANFRAVTLSGEYWRLFTCCFIHIGIIHLLMNMYALLYIGTILEPYLGKTKFLIAYLFTGLLASVASIWWHDLTVSAGASGAIFGMYGVFIALLSTSIIDKATRQALLPSIIYFTGYNLLFGMKGNIDNAAHIGGLLSGIIIGYIYIFSLKKPELNKITAGIVSLSSIIFAIIVCKTIPNDIGTYNKRISEEFVEMESKAMSFYSLPENTPTEKILSNIKDTGLFYWDKNKQLILDLDKMDLPEMIHLRNATLLNYCNLRIKNYELIYKAINENSSAYDTEITNCNNQIETIINSLN